MTSWDYHIGFEKEPQDIHQFLISQGFTRDARPYVMAWEKSGEGNGENATLVDITYHPQIAIEEDAVPDWRKSGGHVTSELFITTKDLHAEPEALRITRELAQKYNAIVYDPEHNRYFTRNDFIVPV